jgi:hypothetical protein
MKIYAHYDLTGTIRSIVSLDAPKDAGLMLAPQAGVIVAEVDGVKLKSAQDLDELRQIATTNKVSSPTPRCTLSKKK